MGAICQKKLGKVFLAKAFAFSGPAFLEMLHSFPFVSHLTVPQDSFSLGCYFDNFLYHLLSPFDSRRIKTQVLDFRTSPSGSVVKNLPTIQEMKVPSLDQEDLLEEGVITHSGILPGESHGHRSLVGYSL